jgi:peptidoglycan/LPS O-acetylase OafA/YrhL
MTAMTPRQEPNIGNIGDVAIDPSAEASAPSKTTAGGRAEEAFYERAKLQDGFNREALKIGWLGRVWGYSTSAPINIAGLIAFISFIVWIGTFVAANPESKVAPEVGKNAFTLITTCLAYIFGASTSKKDE